MVRCSPCLTCRASSCRGSPKRLGGGRGATSWIGGGRRPDGWGFGPGPLLFNCCHTSVVMNRACAGVSAHTAPTQFAEHRHRARTNLLAYISDVLHPPLSPFAPNQHGDTVRFSFSSPTPCIIHEAWACFTHPPLEPLADRSRRRGEPLALDLKGVAVADGDTGGPGLVAAAQLTARLEAKTRDAQVCVLLCVCLCMRRWGLWGVWAMEWQLLDAYCECCCVVLSSFSCVRTNPSV